ncbi:MAG: hypothetical protein WD768_13475 [Phycisphaeraceae bacterium]
MAAAGCTTSDATGETVNVLNEQLVLMATIVGAVAALPALIEFLAQRRRRKERLALSMEDVPVSSLKLHAAGLEGMLDDIADLIDRARHPADYRSTDTGNEILILAGNQMGKKALARAIAIQAKLDRIITIFNPRNADALARVRSLIRKYRSIRIMVLMPGLDVAFAHGRTEIISELNALIETTSESPNVLVIGTALYLQPDSQLDNAFGVKVLLPGTPHHAVERAGPAGAPAEELQGLLASVVRHCLDHALRVGFTIEGMPQDQAAARLLKVVHNPAEVRDIVALCQTTAIYRHRQLKAPTLAITSDVMEKAIRRVVTGTVIGQGATNLTK